MPVTNIGGVPAQASGVTAVVLNVTVTEPRAASYLTVYPTGVSRPTASNLNFGAGQSVPNLVIVKVGDFGKVTAFNCCGFTHIIFDVVGWYGGAGDGRDVCSGRFRPPASWTRASAWAGPGNSGTTARRTWT